MWRSCAAHDQVTYGQLAERVNRCGHALRERLELGAGERLLLLALDGPEFIYTFFGAIKIGAVPIPANTLWKPAEYAYLLNDSCARVLVVSAALLPQIVDSQSGTPASSSHRGHRRRARRHYRIRGAPGRGVPGADGRRYQPRRRGLLAVFVWQHRLSQGMRPPPARHGGVHRALREGDPRNH